MSRKICKVFQQSGVIPYRVQDGRVEVLLITTRDRRRWAIPKGGISHGMSPPASAAKEAWEEAGVIGQVCTEEFAIYEYRKQGKIYQVSMYLLPVEIVSEVYPEASKRKRRWIEITKAVRRIKTAPLKQVFQVFIQTGLDSYVLEH
ncbi:NUDIX hydrolase [Fortiea contorta]|uniref:NUDIX hydrolase n=1 Tax=Fortiea contorta TaxID=1892405 RepID=UPI00034CAF75|nr:NUDIX hydrolase [Fortiea contorta]